MTAREPTTLDGTLERVVFRNEENQWTVARVVIDDTGMEVSAVGELMGVEPGTPLRLTGQWVIDPRYGRQFKVSSFQTRLPETLVGIERYLGSGLVPGIGPSLAKRIVDHFGLDTLEVIASDPAALEQVDGIGNARARSIAEAWTDQRDIQEVMIFLRGHGVSAAYATRIYKRYGKQAIRIVRENPYRLAIDIWGIGFRTADDIARQLGIERDAPERVEAGIVHVLGQLGDDGHTLAPEEHVTGAARELLDVPSELFRPAIDRLVLSGLVTREPSETGVDHLSLARLHDAECAAAEGLAHLAAAEARPVELDSDRAMAEIEAESGIELAPAQRRAIAAATRDKLVVITGGPGVGKTTIVRSVVIMLGRAGHRFALAAPTGRAAKRLSESTANQATTLHRLLEFNPRALRFERNSEHPLDVDAVIVDETSMVDTLLFRSLVAALPEGARLILVGDVDQLPSVGPGAVLADVMASGAATVVELTEIFRQAAASEIVVNAHRVNRGELPELSPPRGSDPDRSDFYFVARDDPAHARDTVVELVAERIPTRFGLDRVRDIQVLTPMHRGELGTIALNAALQERIGGGAHAAGLLRNQRTFRVGDKVMQIRNNYDKDAYNGDVGVITDVDDEAGAARVTMLDGRSIEYQQAELDEIVHAFAISVHKSQGSEYPAVVIPLMTQHYMMLQRNLLYTAITRGKKLVVLVGSQKAVAMAVRNQASKQRWTWLDRRIRTAMAD